MGLTDKHLTFSSQQAVTTSAVSTNTYNTGSHNTLKNLGAGQPWWVIILVRTAVTSSGDPDVTIALDSDSTSDLATSATTHDSVTLKKAALTLGTRIALQGKSGQYEQYIGVNYTVGSGGPLTAGAFDAFFTTNPDEAYQAYNDALS